MDTSRVGSGSTSGPDAPALLGSDTGSVTSRGPTRWVGNLGRRGSLSPWESRASATAPAAGGLLRGAGRDGQGDGGDPCGDGVHSDPLRSLLLCCHSDG